MEGGNETRVSPHLALSAKGRARSQLAMNADMSLYMAARLPALSPSHPTSIPFTLPPHHELHTYHSWKLAAWVESQKLMPITAVADSPGASNSEVVGEGGQGIIT